MKIDTQQNGTFYHSNAPTNYIQANGTTYAYRSLGKGSDVPIVLLQHFTGTMDNWDPAVTDGLAKDRQVILFNNKGVGSSTGKTPESVVEMARDAMDFIWALGYERVDLLGFSLGGFIALEIAANYRSLVRKVILAGTGPVGSEGITQLETVINQGMKDGPEHALVNLFFTKTGAGILAGGQFMKRIQQRTVDRDSPSSIETVGAQASAIVNYGSQSNNNHEQLLAIKCPVLIVNGTADLIVPTINSYVLSQYIEDSKLVIWSDAGHGALFQYHEDFLREAEDFLTRS